jgi:hypothetical protein
MVRAQLPHSGYSLGSGVIDHRNYCCQRLIKCHILIAIIYAHEACLLPADTVCCPESDTRHLKASMVESWTH